MKFTNQCIKVSILAIVCLLSYVLKIDAFSSTSPVVSALLRSYSTSTSSSVLYQQILDVDDNENNNATGELQQPPRPFFFTGEPKSEAENRELRRVFLGVESLLRSSADDTIENEVAAYMDANDSFLKGTNAGEEGATAGFAINIDQERENLERLFRM